MNFIKHIFENTQFGARNLEKREMDMVNAAMSEFQRRGVGADAAQIAHIFAFGTQRTVTDDFGRTVTVGGSEHTGLFMGDFGQNLGSVIGLNQNAFTELRKNLFSGIGEQVRYVMAHELGHAVDIGGDKANPGDYSGHAAFEMGVGKIAKEMEAAAKDDANPFRKLLRHTPFNKEYDGRPRAAQRELFAQAYAMYVERNGEMREHLPLTYAHMKEHFDAKRTKGLDTVQQSTGVDGGGLASGQDRGAASAQGNNPGTSRSAGVQGAGGRPIRSEPAAAGRVTPAQQLQTYLDANAGKNKVWETVARKALAEGNEKQITGTLAAARKQFGELPVDAELKRHQMSKAVDPEWSRLNTPEFSKFAKEIDDAKSSDDVEIIISGEPDWGAVEQRIRSANERADRGVFEHESRRPRAVAQRDAAPATTSLNVPGATKQRRVQDAGVREEVKFSKQTASTTTVTKEEATAEVHRLIGEDINLLFAKSKLIGGGSGRWTPGDTMNTIALAIDGDMLSAARHESLHQFFSMLGKRGDETTQAFLNRMGKNKVILNKLDRLLDGHPKAQAQVQNSPEEAMAFLFQFWAAGQIKLGPETTTLFEKIKGFIGNVAKFLASKVSMAYRKEYAHGSNCTVTF